MSMYNLVHGVHPVAGLALHLLGASSDDFGRFRDAWIETDGADWLDICILTRCGGGNRDDYPEVFDACEKMPGFRSADDDDFDSTYCTFRFACPPWDVVATSIREAGAGEESIEKLREVLDGFKGHKEPGMLEKTNAAIAALKNE